MKMMTLVILFAVAVSPVGSNGPQQTWETKDYHSMMDGNELYTICQKAEKTITVLGGEMDISLHSPKDAYATGKCLGYVAAVVDAIPLGEGFDPPTTVRLNQYMDVVLLYLHNNPDKRQEPAYYLVRVALSNAFPTRR